MRSVYLFIFLLLSVAVLAEEAIFTISIGESKQLAFAATLGTTTAYPATATLNLSGSPFVQQLQVVVNLPRCAFTNSYSCGSIKLCVKYNTETEKTCKALTNERTQTIIFIAGKQLSKAEFSYEGSRLSREAGKQIIITSVVQVGGATATIVRELFSLRGS